MTSYFIHSLSSGSGIDPGKAVRPCREIYFQQGACTRSFIPVKVEHHGPAIIRKAPDRNLFLPYNPCNSVWHRFHVNKIKLLHESGKYPELIAQRHELCEDMAQMLVEPCQARLHDQGLSEDLILERTAAGLAADGAGFNTAEATWVVTRVAELLGWPHAGLTPPPDQPPPRWV